MKEREHESIKILEEQLDELAERGDWTNYARYARLYEDEFEKQNSSGGNAQQG